MRDTERDRERQGQGEKQAPWREPNMGIDPGTPGSRPGPRASAKPLGHAGIPKMKDLNQGVPAEKCEAPQRKGQTDAGKSSLFIHTAHRLGFRNEA